MSIFSSFYFSGASLPSGRSGFPWLRLSPPFLRFASEHAYGVPLQSLSLLLSGLPPLSLSDLIRQSTRKDSRIKCGNDKKIKQRNDTEFVPSHWNTPGNNSQFLHLSDWMPDYRFQFVRGGLPWIGKIDFVVKAVFAKVVFVSVLHQK